ncbi:MAG: cytidylyltransferase domain-containing protein, partial [Planctomycetia bacterium]
MDAERTSGGTRFSGGRPRGVVAIPARLASTRLPNKLLLAETGRPLLAHVIERAAAAVELSNGLLTEVVVAADDDRLLRIAAAYGARAVATGFEHRCGTTRIAEAVAKLYGDAPPDFVVNVQGDEPELSPTAVLRVAEVLLDDATADMSTLVVAMPVGTEALKSDPN